MKELTGKVLSMKPLYEDVSIPVGELTTLVFKHFGKNPMSWTGIDKLTEYAHNEQFVNKVLDLYAYLKSADGLIEGINPSQYYKIIYKFQLASKSMEIDTSQLVDCYLFLANYAVRLYNKYFTEIQQFSEQAKFTEFSSGLLKRNVAYLSALLRGYSETVYCDEHTVSGEIFAPVPCKDGFLIAKKYLLLNASELYPVLESCPYSYINIYVKYRDIPTELSTDIVGNLLVNINMIPYMESFYIEVADTDRRSTSVSTLNELFEIIQYFQSIVPRLADDYKALPLQDRLWKKIECEYYALKPVLDRVGENWKPVPYEITAEQLSPNRAIVKANEEIAQITSDETVLEKLFELNDPRIHFS